MRRDEWRADATAGAAALVCAATLAASGCQERGTRGAAAVPAPDGVAAVAAARIVFIHQSVGDDIVQGLDGVAPLRVMDTAEAADSLGPFFAHARLGRNGDPRSKTDAFVAVLESGLGRRVDIALQKYCFADIDETTDVDALFDYYQRAMTRVHREFPALTLVHVTTPLMQVQGGARAALKKMLGRMPDHYGGNFAREHFNERLRLATAGREPLFDLAALEAGGAGTASGNIQFGAMRGRALLPQYTSDGGHLNEQGRDRIARALVAYLGRVIADRAAAGGRLR